MSDPVTHYHVDGRGRFPNPASLRSHLVIAHNDEGARDLPWDKLPARHAEAPHRPERLDRG